jgi:hypothetical protein
MMRLLKKKVSFSEEPSTFVYERPAAREIYKLYYQDHDYRRFREEKWLDDVRDTRAQIRKATSAKQPSRRRDSLNMMQGQQSRHRKQQGIAQAA